MSVFFLKQCYIRCGKTDGITLFAEASGDFKKITVFIQFAIAVCQDNFSFGFCPLARLQKNVPLGRIIAGWRYEKQLKLCSNTSVRKTDRSLLPLFEKPAEAI